MKEERVSQVTKEENVRIEQEIECPRSKTCFSEERSTFKDISNDNLLEFTMGFSFTTPIL
ncbi:MAG: hypothetical protein WA323_12115 [Candidatus Nitrosopolaris sp.]